MQGSKGFDKTNPTVDYNQQFKRLNTQLNKLTNQNLIKIPKQTKNKKTFYKTLGTSIITAQYPLMYLYFLNLDYGFGK